MGPFTILKVNFLNTLPIWNTYSLEYTEPIKEVPSSHNSVRRLLAQRIMGAKCPSVVFFEILHSEGSFEVSSLITFSLEQSFKMAAMIVLTPKCPLEADLSLLEHSQCFCVRLAGLLQCFKALWRHSVDIFCFGWINPSYSLIIVVYPHLRWDESILTLKKISQFSIK